MKHFYAWNRRDRSPRVQHAERCAHCARRYVNMSAHLSRCKAIERKPVQMRPMAEINSALDQIAWRHGFTVAQLQDRCRSTEACAARRECYVFLRSERWSISAIAAHFNRAERTVCAVFASEAAKQRQRDYLRQWWARHKQGEQAA